MLVKYDLRKVLRKSTAVNQIIKNLPLVPGTSFLCNYGELKKQYRRYDEVDVINYIILASYRDYKNCKLTGDYSLDRLLCPLSIEQINLNKLIWIHNNRIFFWFEEEYSKEEELRKMGIKFNKTEGAAKKSDVKYMTLSDGENRFRMVGDVLARYVYWVKNGKANAAFECLSFDRELEKFTNLEKDWVPEMVEQYQGTPRKETRCAWAYSIQVIDRADGKLKVLNLKKRMFETIKSMAAELGDPTDPVAGYDLIVERRKTGPQVYNVEYDVKQMKIMKEKSKPNPESDAEIMANLKNIDVLLPRPTPTEQKEALEKFLASATEEAPEVEAEGINELED